MPFLPQVSRQPSNWRTENPVADPANLVTGWGGGKGEGGSWGGGENGEWVGGGIGGVSEGRILMAGAI